MSKSFKELLQTSISTSIQLEGKMIEGIVLAIKNNILTIDLGLKENFKFPISEMSPSKRENVKVGDSLLFYVDSLEGQKGEIVLNHQKAEKEILAKNIWQTLQKNRKYVNGIVLNYVKGGLSVGVAGTVAFLPKNQIYPIKDKRSIIGSMKTFRILSMNPWNRNIVLSRTEIIKELQNGSHKIRQKG